MGGAHAVSHCCIQAVMHPAGRIKWLPDQAVPTAIPPRAPTPSHLSSGSSMEVSRKCPRWHTPSWYSNPSLVCIWGQAITPAGGRAARGRAGQSRAGREQIKSRATERSAAGMPCQLARLRMARNSP